jgi:hypothetical protein
VAVTNKHALLQFSGSNYERKKLHSAGLSSIDILGQKVSLEKRQVGDDIKTFSSSLTFRQNKLECLSFSAKSNI